MINPSLASRWQNELDALKAQGCFRELIAPQGHDFSSNDYLGMGKRLPPETARPRGGMASRLLGGASTGSGGGSSRFGVAHPVAAVSATMARRRMLMASEGQPPCHRAQGRTVACDAEKCRV